MSVLSAHAVAAELRRRLPGVGVKKLHKLLYYCQGHHLAAFGEPLFADTISAWDLGPVVTTVWFQERELGPRDVIEELTEAHLNTVGYVLSRYGALTGADLERLTHGEAPWQDANRRRRPGASAKIPLEAIESQFKRSDEDELTTLPDVEAVSAWLRDADPNRPARRDSVDDLRARLASRL